MSPGCQYQYFIVLYCCTLVLLYAKMLKDTETEETVCFEVTFLSLVAFRLGGLAPPGYAYSLGDNFNGYFSKVSSVSSKDARLSNQNKHSIFLVFDGPNINARSNIKLPKDEILFLIISKIFHILSF